MQKTVLSFLFLCIVSVASGSVMTTVYRADGNTPLEPIEVNLSITKYPDIMVGTKLIFVVDSNVAEYWYGGALVLEEADMINLGRLYGRDCDGFECPGSCLPDAGEFAYAAEIEYPGPGVDFYGGEEPNVGDWFIFDYNAIDIGDCNVAFYNYEVNENEPIYILVFHHVRSRDFNKDTVVDFADFAALSLYWQETNCGNANDCEGTDIDIDGKVDVNDLMLFTNFWLDRTE